MPASLTRHAANAVTALRIALTPVFLYAVLRAEGHGSGWPAAALFTAVAVSDFADGRVARRFGTATAGGRVLDHAADIVFVLASLALYVALGAAPWWVPASIAAAFSAYVVDSLRRGPRRSPIGSRIGHLGGVCNYALIGVLVGNDTVGLEWLSPWTMRLVFAAVPLYSAAAILARLAAV